MSRNDRRLGPILRAAEELLGPCVDTGPLGGGLSGAGVFRLRCAGGSCVAKLGASEREIAFYTSVAPALAECGVPVPKLLVAVGQLGERALLLEDIDQPLPRERWLADTAVLAYLRRLHALTPADLSLADPFRPRWTARMTQALMALLPVDAEMEGTVRRIQRWRAALFAPACMISGDPNPTNWSVREDGTVVLFDWERVGYGTPALDLAITVPGLGTPDDYRRVVEGYLRAGPSPELTAPQEGPVERLAYDIALANL